MDTSLDDIESAVQESFAKFFAAESTPDVVRSAEPTGFHADLWRRTLAVGALQMALPESAGGDEASGTCLALVAEQLGKTLAPVPWVDSVAALRAVARSDGEGRDVLAAALRGDVVVVVSPRAVVDGTAPLVPAGAVGDHVLALEGDALVLARVNRDASPALPNLGAMPLANCVLTGERIVLATGPAAREQLELAHREAKTLLAAALVGSAQASLDMALEYVVQRKAFGTPIGSFQTISHALADSVVEIDGARLLAYKAAWSLDHDPSQTARLSAMAFTHATEVARRASSRNLHFHGGTGFTMEHDSQLHYRRAQAWPLAHTTLEDERQRLADALYGPREGIA